ncbi:MAG: helicase C-terminal domain-containing protein [Planctomycetota bacterium]
MTSLAARDILGEGGAVARAIGERYEARDEQLRMASSVGEAMDSGGKLLVEAGTGVGKSFAYLVPAMLRAARHGQTVVIATHTIALQEQLVEKDIPALQAALADAGVWDEGDAPVRAVLVKGRGNYVSIRRLKLASQRQKTLLPDAASRRSLHQIEDWAYATTDGTLSTLPQLERPGVWDKAQSDSANCMGRRCPHHAECFYQRARKEMEGANILVCNHALFFSDLALRTRGTGFLPVYQHVVLDEAHAVEDVAAEHFGVSLTEGRVQHLLSTLYQSRTGKGYLSHLELASGEIKPIDRAVRAVDDADRAARGFFDDVVRLMQSPETTNGRIRRGGAIRNDLSEAMNGLTLALRRLKDEVRTEADRFELNSYSERAGEIADAAELLVDQTLEGCVYWGETNERQSGGASGRRRVRLACSPIDVAPLLRAHLFEKDHGVVLTSATLATRTAREDEPGEHKETAFAHAMERLGCEGAKTVQLGSPFDFASQVELYVDASMPSPGWKAARGRSPEDAVPFEHALTTRVLDHVVATEGGAFVLFTSFRTLYDVADRLEPALAELGYPLLVQGRGLPRGELLAAFRETPGAVLLGAASFWQGVDVPGDRLRNVIITRLPFDPPDRPLTEARLERIKERGGDPFREDSLPRAVIRFKQGFGRLIRTSGDRGRVVVLDSRIVKSGYGRSFLSALPAGIEITELS